MPGTLPALGLPGTRDALDTLDLVEAVFCLARHCRLHQHLDSAHSDSQRNNVGRVAGRVFIIAIFV